MISQEAVNFVTNKVRNFTDSIWSAKKILVEEATDKGNANNLQNIHIEHFCAALVHPDTGETTLSNTRKTSFEKEVGILVQGDTKTKTKGKNYIFAMTHEEIK